MTDHSQGEDPSLESFGRHLLGGGVLGLGVGASWEGMAWLWAPSQFATLRLLIMGSSLGLVFGFVTWLASAGHERSQRHVHPGIWRRSALASALATVARISRTDYTGKSCAWHLACSVLVGLAVAVSDLKTHWANDIGQWVFILVGWMSFGAALGAFVWLIRIAKKDGNAEPTSQPTSLVARATNHKTAPAPPAPFEHRLASYLGCSKQELHEPLPRPQSTMPFWSIVELHSYIGPKPVWIIRRILERIRATVRRSRIRG